MLLFVPYTPKGYQKITRFINLRLWLHGFCHPLWPMCTIHFCNTAMLNLANDFLPHFKWLIGNLESSYHTKNYQLFLESKWYNTGSLISGKVTEGIRKQQRQQQAPSPTPPKSGLRSSNKKPSSTVEAGKSLAATLAGLALVVAENDSCTGGRCKGSRSSLRQQQTAATHSFLVVASAEAASSLLFLPLLSSKNPKSRKNLAEVEEGWPQPTGRQWRVVPEVAAPAHDPLFPAAFCASLVIINSSRHLAAVTAPAGLLSSLSQN